MIPRIRFANLPTPLTHLPRLSEHLGGPDIWVKRDDLTGLAFGGNKTRKLEFVLADAIEKGAQTLVSVGAAQSNHCRQTAALAAKNGLDCILVLAGDPDQSPSGNLLVDKLVGAEIVFTTRDKLLDTFESAVNQAEKDGRKPYRIPLGASDPIGSVAYAFAIEELLGQISGVDRIIFPSSSGGTQAGLALGARRMGWKGQVLGISVDHSVADLQKTVSWLATQASEKIGEKIEFQPEDIHVNADYLGAGYGIMGAPEEEVIKLFARHEGMIVGPVYMARAAAGMIDLIRKGEIKPDEKIVLWHTGGTPTIFADGYAELIRKNVL